MIKNVELPKGVYEKLTAIFAEKLSQGALLIDNNYAYGATSKNVAHIDYVLPNQKGYERLLIVSEELHDYTTDYKDTLSHTMDKVVKVYEEAFVYIGNHFSDYASKRTVKATYYVLGGLLLTEDEALTLSSEITRKREQRSTNRSANRRAYRGKEYTFTVKGLNFKGFKRGENTITLYLDKNWGDDEFRKYFNVKNSLTGKGTRGGNFSSWLRGYHVDGLTK